MAWDLRSLCLPSAAFRPSTRDVGTIMRIVYHLDSSDDAWGGAASDEDIARCNERLEELLEEYVRCGGQWPC